LKKYKEIIANIIEKTKCESASLTKLSPRLSVVVTVNDWIAVQSAL